MNPNQHHQQQQTEQNAASAMGHPQNMSHGAAPAQDMMSVPGHALPPQHWMGLMSNPALAAAAAASPAFPTTAMLSNPGAFLSMQIQPQQQLQNATRQATSNTSSLTQPHPQPATMATIPGYTCQMQQQQAAVPIAPFGSVNQFGVASVPSSSACLLAPAAQKGSTKEEKGANRMTELTPAERAKQNRDRNREHARSTRLRKKAYVQKLKELVEGLHAERTDEARKRRVAIQHLAETQNVRRGVVRTFLRYRSNYEADERKWSTILEDNFWLKQPVTPYQSFRRADIEKDCRICRGVEAVICDAASLSVMTEGIGSRSLRWMQIKREEFLHLEQAKRGSRKMPRCIVRQPSRLQHTISSLSASSDSSNHGSSSSGQAKETEVTRQPKEGTMMGPEATDPSKTSVSVHGHKVSSSSGSGSGSGSGSDNGNKQDASKDFHDYNAKPLPDPKLGDSESSPSAAEEDSPEESSGSANGDGKRPVSTDSSSGDDSAEAAPRAAKRRKTEGGPPSETGNASDRGSFASELSSTALPPNISRTGGIHHNIRPADSAGNGAARLQEVAPAIMLPPFTGIGKRAASAPSEYGSRNSITGSAKVAAKTGPAVVAADLETSSTEDSDMVPQIRGNYFINEDDMILMDDVLMCPFTFRSQDAVLCGTFSECVMPGMLRAHFSLRNKLLSVELIHDAMGFMQQLERASGSEGSAQIVCGSLEMALVPSTTEARVITLAQAPYLIVNVNEVWTRTTGYTQLDVEGKEYLSVLEGEGTVPEAEVRRGKPPHKLEEIAKGRPACSTNIHYDSDGRDFIEFVCSYPLTNASDEITHILHVSKELPSFHSSMLQHRQPTR